MGRRLALVGLVLLIGGCGGDEDTPGPDGREIDLHLSESRAKPGDHLVVSFVGADAEDFARGNDVTMAPVGRLRRPMYGLGFVQVGSGQEPETFRVNPDHPDADDLLGWLSLRGEVKVPPVPPGKYRLFTDLGKPEGRDANEPDAYTVIATRLTVVGES